MLFFTTSYFDWGMLFNAKSRVPNWYKNRSSQSNWFSFPINPIGSTQKKKNKKQKTKIQKLIMTDNNDDFVIYLREKSFNIITLNTSLFWKLSPSPLTSPKVNNMLSETIEKLACGMVMIISGKIVILWEYLTLKLA